MNDMQSSSAHRSLLSEIFDTSSLLRSWVRKIAPVTTRLLMSPSMPKNSSDVACAPALNNNIWLYGGDKATIVETISKSRRGVMPAWGKHLDDATVKQLAIYVHSLGGGK